MKFADSALRQLIREYTREAGVRQLEREIAALSRKATRKIISRNGKAATVKLDAENLKDYLGHAPFIAESAEKITEYGIATGLAWTPVGGDILFIEATRMRGRGNLLLTGSLGEVMKESAQTAVSYLRSQAKKLDLDLSDYGKFDFAHPRSRRRDAEGRAERGRGHRRGAGVAADQAARAFPAWR